MQKVNKENKVIAIYERRMQRQNCFYIIYLNSSDFL